MLPSSPFLLLHVSSAAVGLLAGAMAMFVRKGSGLHGAAGNVFVLSMLSMSATAAYMATFVKPNAGNMQAALLMSYLVATAWVTARRRERKVGNFDRVALLYALAIGARGMFFGFQAATSPTGVRDGYPAPMYFIFGTVALLFALSDVRLLVRGGVAGAQRIGRHLWRMCFALLFATASFYPGQAKLFSRALRQTNLLYEPLVLLIGMTIFWMVRVSWSKKAATT